MSEKITQMRREINVIPDAVERLLTKGADLVEPTNSLTSGGVCSFAATNNPASALAETANVTRPIHAESYSAAEVADALSAKGAQVFATTSHVKRASVLPHVRTAHWMTDPIPTIAAFDGMVEKVATQRGIYPDKPRHQKKVTGTV
ncbi:MAG: hypothetical protein AB3N19_08015 [Ruegeria sp.]